MGNITNVLMKEKDLRVFTVTGEVTAEQVLEQILTVVVAEPTQFVLWDIRAGDLSSLSGMDARMIVERARPYVDLRKGGRTAIVCPKDLDYGISRMIENLAEVLQFPFEILVSRSMEEATAWLFTLEKDTDSLTNLSAGSKT
jgi:hypothetical protein